MSTKCSRKIHLLFQLLKNNPMHPDSQPAPSASFLAQLKCMDNKHQKCGLAKLRQQLRSIPPKVPSAGRRPELRCHVCVFSGCSRRSGNSALAMMCRPGQCSVQALAQCFGSHAIDFVAVGESFQIYCVNMCTVVHIYLCITPPG